MVSFWPWKANDASPASFEKALAALASRIAATQAKLDRTRAASRRVRVLCTLYLSFGYLVYAIVLVLVVGWRKMGAWEWMGIVGGPAAIYAVRTVLAAVYNFRIESLASKLEDQQAERAKTIQRLKDATKYDSTLQLLEKYGGGGEGGAAAEGDKAGGKGGKSGKGSDEKKTRSGTFGPGRTGAGVGTNPSTPNRTHLPPPPTANIPGRATPMSRQRTPRTGDKDHDSSVLAGEASSPLGGKDTLDASAEFAPNAFEPDVPEQPPRLPSGQYAPPASSSGESHWYDRILDLLMGDDETAAKNRIVLICSSCRLVNGQAPPGTRSLAEVGQWRCMGCGALNGETAAAEAQKIVSEALREGRASQRRGKLKKRTAVVADSEAETEEGADDDADDADAENNRETHPADADEDEEEPEPVEIKSKAGPSEGVRRRGRKQK